MALSFSGLNRTGERQVILLERKLRASPMPVIGRMQDKTLLLDLRCLRPDQESCLIQTLQAAISQLRIAK